MYDSTFSPAGVLSEQISRQLFETLPDGGPVIVILDRDGNCWPSDSESFAQLNLSESFLKELRGKVDDGAEPVITQVNDVSIICAQLSTKKTNCGYVVIALPKYSPESTLINIDLLEILISQINLIGRLVEKNNLLYELQLRQHSVAGTYNNN